MACTPTLVSVRYNGKQVMSARKLASERGRFALAMSGFKTVTVRGTFDPSWLQNLQDGVVQAAFAQFEERRAGRSRRPKALAKRSTGSPKKRRDARLPSRKRNASAKR